MIFELRTIAECPNDAAAQALFAEALRQEGFDPTELAVRVVLNDAQAEELNFHGSPTFTVNGSDLFPSSNTPAVTCRVYPTALGLRGNPELDTLRDAIRVITES